MIIRLFPEKGAVATFFGKTLGYSEDLFFPTEANSEKHFLGKTRALLKTSSAILKCLPNTSVIQKTNCR